METTERFEQYLTEENDRNKKHADLYTRMIKLAFGMDAQCIIGHHLTFELNGNLETENEIPSADTLLFDHYAMKKIFGHKAIPLMKMLASVPASKRDQIVINALNNLEKPMVDLIPFGNILDLTSVINITGKDGN